MDGIVACATATRWCVLVCSSLLEEVTLALASLAWRERSLTRPARNGGRAVRASGCWCARCVCARARARACVCVCAFGMAAGGWPLALSAAVRLCGVWLAAFCLSGRGVVWSGCPPGWWLESTGRRFFCCLPGFRWVWSAEQTHTQLRLVDLRMTSSNTFGGEAHTPQDPDRGYVRPRAGAISQLGVYKSGTVRACLWLLIHHHQPRKRLDTSRGTPCARPGARGRVLLQGACTRITSWRGALRPVGLPSGPSRCRRPARRARRPARARRRAARRRARARRPSCSSRTAGST